MDASVKKELEELQELRVTAGKLQAELQAARSHMKEQDELIESLLVKADAFDLIRKVGLE